MTVFVFVHDIWLTPQAWQTWRDRFESAGHKTVAPAWPSLRGDIWETSDGPGGRALPRTIKTIVDHYERVIRQLNGTPLLIGHGTGGLVAQLLLDRGIGAAGVVLNSVLPSGVSPSFSQAFFDLRVITTAGWRSELAGMTLRLFETYYANQLDPSDRPAVFENQVVPAPKRFLFQSALGRGASLDFNNMYRPPLLLVASAHDRIVPRKLVMRNYRRQTETGARTEFWLDEDTSHFLIGEARWEKTADRIKDWLLAAISA